MSATSIRLLPLALLIFMVGIASADGPASPVPQVPDNTVPGWVFYWVLGIGSAGAVIWSTITKMLWDRGSEAQKDTVIAKEKISVLSEEEKGWLRQLYYWHKAVDNDQVPLWYIPRSWLEHIKSLKTDNDAVKGLLIKLVEWNEELISDLRTQLKESRGLQAQQQTKMLKLAVRVQRAVEALAGMESPPAVETDLNDDDDDDDEEIV